MFTLWAPGINSKKTETERRCQPHQWCECSPSSGACHEFVMPEFKPAPAWLGYHCIMVPSCSAPSSSLKVQIFQREPHLKRSQTALFQAVLYPTTIVYWAVAVMRCKLHPAGTKSTPTLWQKMRHEETGCRWIVALWDSYINSIPAPNVWCKSKLNWLVRVTFLKSSRCDAKKNLWPAIGRRVAASVESTHSDLYFSMADFTCRFYIPQFLIICVEICRNVKHT